MRRWIRRLVPLLALAPLAGAAFVLHRELRAYGYEDVRHAVHAIGPRNVIVALALTALSHLLLTGYDTLALRYLGREMPYRRTALASFLGYVFSHNIGLSVLGGTAPRYRLYSAWGLAPGDIALVVGFTAVTFWLGILSVVGGTLAFDATTLTAPLHIGIGLGRGIGLGALAVVVAYAATTAYRSRPLEVRGWSIPVPTPSIALAQVVIGIVDWVVAAGVLYVLLRPAYAPSFPHFVGLFALAQLAGVGSHVPGGLGVFETVMLLGLSPRAPAPGLVGALLAYRVVYYLLPLVVATAVLASFEARRTHARLAPQLAVAGRWLSEMAPQVLAVATFVTGTVLLFTGAARRHAGRLGWLQNLLPLPVLELSHFLASIVGLGLVLLASLGALVPARREFYRRASVLDERFTVGWAVAVCAALAASVWLGFFVHRHTGYSHELWWDFSFFGDAPRFLRATVGVVVAALVASVWHLMRPAPLRAVPPDADSLGAARAIVEASPVASSRLALLGDKTFLFADDRRAFIMYSVVGRSCVAMGDPVGPPASCGELVWQFVELCDQHDTWPVFYEAGPSALPLYLEAGLTPLKFGEEARVLLRDFTLEGSKHKQQRWILRTMDRQGVTFEVRPPADVPALLPELQVISDAWLREKHTREKGFSLGCFNVDYLRQFPVALVRHEGEIVAFANLWCAADREEVCPDLMRQTRSAPSGVMEYLFLRIIGWAQEEGYRWCGLGMAPLAGLESRAVAPLWNRVGALAFRYGEQFYNFQGLRQFKEKFCPEWRPRYLVYPGGIVLPRVLANVAALVSGGLRGIVAK
jgi:phosphatidylglycerol lysyltransferase